ncbi:hypothetical protein D3C81_1981990 [compost metagenome]
MAKQRAVVTDTGFRGDIRRLAFDQNQPAMLGASLFDSGAHDHFDQSIQHDLA